VAATRRASHARLKALSGQCAARPDSTPRARPTARPAFRAAAVVDSARLARAARLPTVLRRPRPPHSTRRRPDSHRPDRRCPSRVVRTAAGHAAAAASPRSRGRGLRMRRARGPSRRPHALCIWAEREFGLVAPG
jgi:hypothetical protein